MEFDQVRAYLLSKPFTTESFPFGEGAHVFKVNSKMFALVGWRKNALMINLKCDPDESCALRDIFNSITTGYHMDKKHWISVYYPNDVENQRIIESSVANNSAPINLVPAGELERIIDNSFMLVVSKMAKKEQTSILLHM
ncbi:MmcQ/YjbR family DNA-binding protein [Shewanella sp. 1_MG-2023]|uniref:MmcQ/YjbR family DNA-binding protein n=1 Tax=unclassified Shewanella TaxID=196818 RepID=UPI0026E39742|nr:MULTISPECIES: MmcQ/YjbR family DNA-binding protein [unclassified Shewanella]MDO6610145.1 MmcQ/YjbR family DNA-binding protein [Shewanella sp. 7_MG-2023]MDO6769713.1 MmcQ/YjbR family DNA-binding protein [Shewanella sp. 2_MG-2023]MDO6792777.1 MmcQ/YjbR family DNA-binding protein [Shewanella sp. 1_MG-2023]